MYLPIVVKSQTRIFSDVDKVPRVCRSLWVI